MLRVLVVWLAAGGVGSRPTLVVPQGQSRVSYRRNVKLPYRYSFTRRDVHMYVSYDTIKPYIVDTRYTIGAPENEQKHAQRRETADTALFTHTCASRVNNKGT